MRQHFMAETQQRRRCPLRVMLWSILLTTALLGTNCTVGQKTRVRIAEEDANRFPRLLARAEPNTVIVMSTEVELSSPISVQSPNVTIRGNSPDARSVVRCAEDVDMAFNVSADGVDFANLEIRDCKGTAVSVSSVAGSDNPFLQQDETNPVPLNVKFQKVHFVDNGSQERDSAGAMFVGWRVTAKINRCVFENNTASRGGAIRSLGTSLQIRNSVFSNNTAVNSGGAVSGGAHVRDDEQERTVSIENTRFVQNRVLEGDQAPSPLSMTSSDVQAETNRHLRLPRPTASGGALSLAHFTYVAIRDSKFEGNSAVPAGGAIYLAHNGESVVWNCTLRNNFVSPIAHQRDGAQGLEVGGAIFVAIEDRSCQLNITSSRFENNRAAYGGALHVVARSSTRVIISRSKFTDNRARSGGGAVILRNVNSPELRSCEFVRNSASIGGAVFVTNGAGLRVKRERGEPRPNFQYNFALDGGAVFGIGTGTVKFADSEFTRNQAYRHGGAICLLDSKAGGEFILQDVRVRSNTAEKGGALFLENMELVKVLATSDEDDRNPLTIQELSDGVNTFSNNSAVAGGAVYYKASNAVRNTMEFAMSRFVNNEVHSNLSALYPVPLDYPGRDEEVSGDLGRRLVQDSKNEVPSDESLLDPLGAEPCYPGGGGAVCFVLTRPSQRAPVIIELTQSSFESNSASVGGGLFLSTEGAGWASRCWYENDPCRVLRLKDLTFVGNSARFAGGGLFASNLPHVYYSPAEAEQSDEPYLPLVESPYTEEFTNNSVESGGYGPNIASRAVYLRIKSPALTITRGRLIRNQSSGQSNPLPNIAVEILDEMNQVVSAGIADSILSVHANTASNRTEPAIVLGQIDAIAKAGVANFTAVAILAKHGLYKLEFEPSVRSVKSVAVTVEIRFCLLGEVTNAEGFVCEMCDVESFSFDNMTNCEACPAHARCGGGASIVPLPNYWHSSPFSTVMLECFNSKACNYRNRTSELESQHYLNRQKFLGRLQNGGENPAFTNEEYTQCSKGYAGPLCGSCKDGYGRTNSKTCRRCESKRVTLVVVLGVTLWQLAFVGITLRIALVSIKDMNHMLVTAESSSSPFAPPARTTADTRTNAGAQGLEHLKDILNNPQTVGMIPEQLHEIYEEFREQIATQDGRVPNSATPTREQLVVEYTAAIEHASETLKIFVNFLQMTSVAISINVEWTEAVRQMLTTMKSIAGLPSGASFSPLACLLDDNMNHRSTYGEILKFSIPVGLILFFVIYYSIRSLIMRKTHSTRDQCMAFLRSRVIISFLVVTHFGYQSLSEEFMGMVSCVRLDSNEIHNESLYQHYSIATDWYWTVDTNIKCSDRQHVLLAGLLGVPGIVFFLFGVPTYLLCVLLCNRSTGRLLDLDVINAYGFVYQAYREPFVFWEVCILARKALIGVVIVFAYPLGSSLQGVMALGVLILALWMHLTAAPFKYDILNLFEGCSLLVSIFAFYAGIVFNDENTTQTGRVFLSAVLVLINVVLVFAFLVSVFHYIDKFAIAKLKFFGIQDIPRNIVLRVWKLVNVVSGQALTSIRDTIRERVYRSRVSANGNQIAHRTITSDACHLLASQPPAQYSDVIQVGNDRKEISVELREDISSA